MELKDFAEPGDKITDFKTGERRIVTEDKALNVIGKPYDADAVMLGRAFAYAASKPLRDFWKNVADYVSDFASDRRYKVKPLVASKSANTVRSAIITYRGRRLYVRGHWDVNAHEHVYTVELSPRA